MGEVRINIKAMNIANGNSLDLDCLVDTGARMLVLPAEDISFLDLESIGSTLVEYADGRKETLNVFGPLRLYYDVGGNQVRVAHIDVIEGKHGVDALFGQVPLEVLDLLVDCPNQRVTVNPESPAMPKFSLK